MGLLCCCLLFGYPMNAKRTVVCSICHAATSYSYILDFC